MHLPPPLASTTSQLTRTTSTEKVDTLVEIVSESCILKLEEEAKRLHTFTTTPSPPPQDFHPQVDSTPTVLNPLPHATREGQSKLKAQPADTELDDIFLMLVKLNEKLEGLEKGSNRRLSSLEQMLGDLGKRLEALEHQTSLATSELQNLNKSVSGLEKKVGSLGQSFRVL